MAKESPLQAMKRLYGSKEKLVDAIVDFAKDPEEDKGEATARLKALSNRKLLRIARVAEATGAKGGREPLASAVAEAEGRGKDADYVAKLGTLSAATLLDRLGAAERRAARAAR